MQILFYHGKVIVKIRHFFPSKRRRDSVLHRHKNVEKIKPHFQPANEVYLVLFNAERGEPHYDVVDHVRVKNLHYTVRDCSATSYNTTRGDVKRIDYSFKIKKAFYLRRVYVRTLTFCKHSVRVIRKSNQRYCTNCTDLTAKHGLRFCRETCTLSLCAYRIRRYLRGFRTERFPIVLCGEKNGFFANTIRCRRYIVSASN